jgi:hypothetical protein
VVSGARNSFLNAFTILPLSKKKSMSDTKRIYTGPTLIAKGLVARLNEIGISPIERNDHDSSLRAGFTMSIANQTMVFIRNDEYAKAQSTIEEFLEEIEE